MKKWKMTTILVILLLSMMVLSGCGSKVDAFQYLTVEFDGYNSNGSARVKGETQLIEAVVGGEPEDFDKMGEWLTAYEELDANLDIDWMPKSNLSNGDTVTVTVTVVGKAAKEILGGTKEFTVSGLSEVETVDLFADVDLEYTGIVGEYTYANVKLLSDDEILKACEFKIDRDCDFQNGDVITVTITNNEYLAENYQVVPAELSKAFTVSGLDAYLTDIADIDLLPEEQIREIIDQYVADSQKEDDFIFSYSESAYYKTYFCIGDKNTIGADRNRLMIYISYDKYMDGTYRETVYAPLIFHDLIMSANGTVVLDYENASKRTHGTDIDKMIETLERDYTVDEVYIEY